MESLSKRIEELEQELWRKIADASQLQDPAQIRTLAQLVDEAGAARAQAEAAESFVERISNQNGAAGESTAGLTSEPRKRLLLRTEDLRPRGWIAPPRSSNPKADGEARRAAFIEQIRALGKELTRMDGVIYRDAANRIVGIASATQRGRDRWWLGLPERDLEVAVLLCEVHPGDVPFLVLGPDFFASYGSNLSRDSRGQLKFNVVRRDGRFYLQVPFHGEVELTRDDPSELA